MTAVNNLMKDFLEWIQTHGSPDFSLLNRESCSINIRLHADATRRNRPDGVRILQFLMRRQRMTPG